MEWPNHDGKPLQDWSAHELMVAVLEQLRPAIAGLHAQLALLTQGQLPLSGPTQAAALQTVATLMDRMADILPMIEAWNMRHLAPKAAAPPSSPPSQWHNDQGKPLQDWSEHELMVAVWDQLRNPASVMRGYTALLTEGQLPFTSPEQAAALQELHQQALQLSNTLEMIRAWNKLQRERKAAEQESDPR